MKHIVLCLGTINSQSNRPSLANIIKQYSSTGAWGSVVVKALRYWSEGPGSIPGGVTGFFSDIFLSDRTRAMGSTQFLVKMSTR